MKTFILLALLLTTACAGNKATGPSPAPAPQPPATVTLTGHLTATNGGHPLPGVQAVVGATTTQTDGGGAFSATGLPTAAATLSLTGTSIVPRTLQVALTGNRDMSVSAIATSSPFDLTFYRQFVRDSTESSFYQPLRRWTVSPSLYLQTGLADARTLDLVESVARAAVPQWTDGKLNVAAVERGPSSRAGTPGWLTVLFSAEVGGCGVSDVGKDGGSITFYPRTPNCGCAPNVIRPVAIRHELGHAMGFYHTDSVADVMYRVATQCDMPLSARERYHSAIAYARPVGNFDPDTDAAATVSLAPMRVVQ